MGLTMKEKQAATKQRILEYQRVGKEEKMLHTVLQLTG